MDGELDLCFIKPKICGEAARRQATNTQVTQQQGSQYGKIRRAHDNLMSFPLLFVLVVRWTFSSIFHSLLWLFLPPFSAQVNIVTRIRIDVEIIQETADLPTMQPLLMTGFCTQRSGHAAKGKVRLQKTDLVGSMCWNAVLAPPTLARATIVSLHRARSHTIRSRRVRRFTRRI